MTDDKKRRALAEQIIMGCSSGLSLEIRKTKLGAGVLLSGVIGISELTDSSITVLSHFGRVHFSGECLVLSVFSERTVEIIGKITGVEFSYGKN